MASVSKVSICNMAIGYLQKSNAIISITQNSTEAVLLNTLFDETLDVLLEGHPWNFAVTRAELARLAAAPEFEYTYQFQLPNYPYCLRVLEVYDGNENEITDYRIEGRYLLCNSTSVLIKYIKRVTNYSEMSPSFRTAFAYYLASELAEPLTNSSTLATNMTNKFAYFIKKARMIDAKQDKAYVERDSRFEWDMARM